MTVRVLVTGSRSWVDRDVIQVALERVVNEHRGDNFTLVVGDCPSGADAIAVEMWHEIGQPHREVHSAHWRAEGKAAGPQRNQRMVDAGADIALAFPLGDSRGTRDCMRRAEAAGIPVRNYGAGS